VTGSDSKLHRARYDFSRAKRQAMMRRIWAQVTGQNNDLIPFEDLRKTLGLINQRYRGVQPVPLDKIIGSLGRSRDFDRVFLPTQGHSQRKWLSIDSAHMEGVTLPPVQLYKVGDAYFVVDGHHRVSVARQKEQAFIDAEVTEVQSRMPVTADLTVDDLDVLGAYRDFLDQTRLDVLRTEQNIRLTMPGDYARLLDHIRVHKYFVETEQSKELSWEEAVTHWYDHVYKPLVQTIRRYRLLADFPGQTEADLYLWIIEHAYHLSRRMNQDLPPSEVATEFATRFGHRPRRIWQRVRRFITNLLVPDPLETGPRAGSWREERVETRETEEHLFRNILTTLTGADTGWRAVAQAAEFARREGSVLHGLHVATSGEETALAYGRRVLDEFTFRCGSLGIKSSTSLAVGDVAEHIIERSRWVDMVVINQRRVHGRWAQRPLGTIFQRVAEQAMCPILAVPGTRVLPLRRVVVAYDGSPKAREALYVFKHLLRCWKVGGVILTVQGGRADREELDRAWQYVQQAGSAVVSTRYEEGPADQTILRVVEEEDADLLLMGGYGHQPLIKAFLGSTVDRVLREAWFPVLICR
jgi:nucleotide-binding universal stress UspA family protein